jgi:hypothetical protein
MAFHGLYYLNAPTLLQATAVFYDVELTLYAPDGFYSDSTIAREQVSGHLLAPNACPSCSPSCGGTISVTGNEGVYLMNINTGNSTGAIIIRFDPFSIPDGIMATYNGSIYNKLSSPSYGLLTSTVINSPTYIGKVSGDCGLAGNSFILNEYNYNGSSFVPTGNTQSIPILLNQVKTTADIPHQSVMVIPKFNTYPEDILVTIIGACPSTAFDIEISCPTLLTQFVGSLRYNLNSEACAAEDNEAVYYNVPVNGSFGTVGLYDFVFHDRYGINKLSAGWYKVGIYPLYYRFNVDNNGIVVALEVCP